MKNVLFSGDGLALSVNILYQSPAAENLFVTYTYTLWSALSNAIVDEHSGNNFNSQDDKYRLPTPARINNGRVIDIFSMLKNVEDSDLEVRVVVEVSQGDELIDIDIDSITVPGKSTGFSEIFLKLIAQ